MSSEEILVVYLEQPPVAYQSPELFKVKTSKEISSEKKILRLFFANQNLHFFSNCHNQGSKVPKLRLRSASPWRQIDCHLHD